MTTELHPALEAALAGLMVLGALAVAIAGIGIVRMPDLFTRMQATSKAATLGAILLLLATAIDFASLAILVRALIVIVFLALTAPVGAHMLARAGYRAGSRMRDPGAIDEMRSMLAGKEPPAER